MFRSARGSRTPVPKLAVRVKSLCTLPPLARLLNTLFDTVMIAHRKSLLKRSPSLGTVIRRFNPFKSQSHAHPTTPQLYRCSSVCVVQVPYHRVGARYHSFNRTALQGFSSAWPLSVYSPLIRNATYSFSGLFRIGSTPIALHSLPPPLWPVRVGRSYSVVRPFKRACRSFGSPLFPCSPFGLRTSSVHDTP